VDAMLCSVQEGTQESSAMRSHSLRARPGTLTELAITIEFCMPEKLRKQSRTFIAEMVR
jgi:hypothetical protein